MSQPSSSRKRLKSDSGPVQSQPKKGKFDRSQRSIDTFFSPNSSPRQSSLGSSSSIPAVESIASHKSSRVEEHIMRVLPFRIENEEDWRHWLDELDIRKMDRLVNAHYQINPYTFDRSLTESQVGELSDKDKKIHNNGTTFEDEKVKQNKIIDLLYNEKEVRGNAKSEEKVEIENHFNSKMFEFNSNMFERGDRELLKYYVLKTIGNGWHFVRSIYQIKFVYSRIANEKKFFFYNDQNQSFVWNKAPPEFKSNLTAKLLIREPQLLCFQSQLSKLVIETVVDDFRKFDVNDALNRCPIGKSEEEKMMNVWNSDTKSPKTSAIYFLLDPRKFSEAKGGISFISFLNSIFYIGKTSHIGIRPLKHLTETKDKTAKDIIENFGLCFKKNNIRDIWDDKEKEGVVILHTFEYITEKEANVREGCLIRARTIYGAKQYMYQSSTAKKKDFSWSEFILGPIDLANKTPEIIKGLSWTEQEYVEFGCRLLLRAFGTFCNDRRGRIFEGNLPSKKKPSPDDEPRNLTNKERLSLALKSPMALLQRSFSE